MSIQKKQIKWVVLLCAMMLAITSAVYAQPWPKANTDWVQDSSGKWVQPSTPAQTEWVQDSSGKWVEKTAPSTTDGSFSGWVQNSNGQWIPQEQASQAAEIISFNSSIPLDQIDPSATELTFTWETKNADIVNLVYGTHQPAVFFKQQLPANGSITLSPEKPRGSDDTVSRWSDFDYVTLEVIGLDGRFIRQEVQISCTAEAWFFTNLQINGCPTDPYEVTQMAYQEFERGVMIWHPTEGIYVFVESEWPTRRYHVEDNWKDGNPSDSSPELSAPDGAQKPIRGFGKVWKDLNLQQELGWATSGEQSYQGTTQCMLKQEVWSSEKTCYISSPSNAIYVYSSNGWSYFNSPVRFER